MDLEAISKTRFSCPTSPEKELRAAFSGMPYGGKHDFINFFAPVVAGLGSTEAAFFKEHLFDISNPTSCWIVVAPLGLVTLLPHRKDYLDPFFYIVNMSKNLSLGSDSTSGITAIYGPIAKTIFLGCPWTTNEWQSAIKSIEESGIVRGNLLLCQRNETILRQWCGSCINTPHVESDKPRLSERYILNSRRDRHPF